MAVGRWKVYVVLFTAVMAMYAAYALWSYMRRQEHYTEQETVPLSDASKVGAAAAADADADADAGASDDKTLSKYRAKMYVMKVFDRKVRRKPDDNEIAKYAAFGSKKQIYHAIIRDYNSDDDNAGNDDDSDGDVSDCSDEDDEPPRPKPPPKKTVSVENHEPTGYTAPMTHCTLDHADDDGTPHEHSIVKKGERVCLDKADVLTRIDTICAELKQFRKVVEMM